MNLTIGFRELLFTTVRIQSKFSQRPSTLGTGFLFTQKVDEDSGHLFLVSNRHVVEDATEITVTFTKSDGTGPILGDAIDVTLAQGAKNWHFHPEPRVDIAVLPMVGLLNWISAEGHRPFIRPIPNTMILPDTSLADLSLVEDVTFIGYPSGYYDKAHLLPIVRRGTTASAPEVDFEGLPAFVIDASVFPGSSGSPVFLHNQGSFVKNNVITAGSRLALLGIVAKWVPRSDDSRDLQVIADPAAHRAFVATRESIDIGIVFRASELSNFVTKLISEDKRSA